MSSNVFFFTFRKKVASTSFSLPWQRPLLYRNQSIDLLIRSIDWFLYVYMKVVSVMKELAVVLNIFRICNLHDLFSLLVLTLPLPARVFLFEYFKHVVCWGGAKDKFLQFPNIYWKPVIFIIDYERVFVWWILFDIIARTETNKNPADICLLKISNGNTRTMFMICSKLTKKTPEQHHWRRSGLFIVNFEQISHIFLCFQCWFSTS